MANCSRPIYAKDRNKGEIIAAKQVDKVVDRFVPNPDGQNASIQHQDTGSDKHTSLAACAISWDSATIELDTNIAKEVLKAVDDVTAVVG